MKTTIRYVFLLAALLLSSSSYADIWRYRVFNGSTLYTTSYISPTDACQKIDGLNYNSSSTFIYRSNTDTVCVAGRTGQSWDYNLTIQHTLVNEQCPTGYQQEGNNCVLIPDPECPDGQFLEGGECTTACFEGAQITLTMQFQDVQQNITDPRNGCKLEISSGPLSCNSLMSSCNITFTDTGIYDDNFSWPNGVEPEPVPPVEPAPEPITTETVEGPITETVNNPDGSTTTTETTTTTNVNEQGHLVEIVGDSIVLKNQAGEIIEILQQYETNTYSDGTSQVTETITTTATPNSITEVKKNLTDGSTTVVTRTYNQGLSGSTTTTKTTTYNAQGQPTGSATVTNGSISETDGSGDGDGGGQEGGELCGAPGQPICDVKIHEDPDDVPDFHSELDAQDAEIDGVMNDLMDMLSTDNDFGTNDMDWTKPDYWIANFLNMPQAVSCSGGINTVIFGRPFNLEPCEKLLPLREILAWTFYIITLFTVSQILLGRKLA